MPTNSKGTKELGEALFDTVGWGKMTLVDTKVGVKY